MPCYLNLTMLSKCDTPLSIHDILLSNQNTVLSNVDAVLMNCDAVFSNHDIVLSNHDTDSSNHDTALSIAGMTESEITRLDMITLLCMADRTHSQLQDMMPEKCGLTAHNKDFDVILKEVGLDSSPLMPGSMDCYCKRLPGF